MIVFFNTKINYIIINSKTTSLYLHTDQIFKLVKILKNNFIINFFLKYIHLNFQPKALNFIQKIIKSWTYFFFNKYIVVGKGFKLKKKKKLIIMNFNTSHNFLFFQKLLIFQKFNKKKILLISQSSNITKIKQKINFLYIKNIFLKKNIKLSRSFVLFKKKKQ
jgi:hypothetical protein